MQHRRVYAGLALAGLAAIAAVATGPTAVAEGTSSAAGRLVVLHEDHFDEGASRHRYHLVAPDGERTELLFDDRGPEGLGGRDVRVTGRRERPNVLRVGSSAAVADSGSGAAAAPAQAAPATVTKKVAVILFDFADSSDAERPVTADLAREVVFGTATSSTPTVRQFLTETSFSQLALAGGSSPAGDVFGWVRLDARKTDACAFDSWGQQARQRATSLGFVDNSYDQVIHLMPTGTCNFGGVAYMPGKYSWTVLRKPGDARLIPALRGVTSHEYGHSLGIHHAGSYRCAAGGTFVALSSNCTLEEYGDPFSVLGMSFHERQYHGYQKGRVSWVSQSTTTITATGTYSVSSVSGAAAGPQVLRIARPATKGTTDYYYLELRQPAGSFDAFAATDPVVNGLSVRIAPDYSVNAISKLLDMTPNSILTPANRAIGEGGDFTDAALPIGSSYIDSGMGLTVKLMSITNGVADVAVTMPTATSRGRK